MFSAEHGEQAVRLARRAVVAALAPDPAPLPENGGAAVFDEPRGAFVTLKVHASGQLRGCIGYPLPVLPLRTAIAQAAVAAATEDPRFPPVRAAEVNRLTFEVSVLTVPVPVRGSRPEEIVTSIQAGRDGLIVEGYGTSGLLLPQVAPEMGWSAEDLLNGTCRKAGLPAGAWRDSTVRIRRFEADVFTERSPAGPVDRTSL